MKAPITQAQAWAVIAESAGWNAKELPVLPDHPEPRIMKWSALEIEAIQAYGAACAAHAREMALSEAARVAADDNAAWQDGVTGMARAAYSWADAMLEARK